MRHLRHECCQAVTLFCASGFLTGSRPHSWTPELALCRGDIPGEEAVQIYTNGHWLVPADLLAEVEYFARFAVGVYGFDMEVLKQRNWWKTLKKALAWRKQPSNRDALNRWLCAPRPQPLCSSFCADAGRFACRSKMKQLYQRLFYEGVREEIGRSSELLYVSVENQVLSHLPYIIALDHASRQASLLFVLDTRCARLRQAVQTRRPPKPAPLALQIGGSGGSRHVEHGGHHHRQRRRARAAHGMVAKGVSGAAWGGSRALFCARRDTSSSRRCLKRPEGQRDSGGATQQRLQGSLGTSGARDR